MEAHSKRCLGMSIRGLCGQRSMELVRAVIIIPSICTTTWCTYIYWVFYLYKNYKIFPELKVLPFCLGGSRWNRLKLSVLILLLKL